MYYTTPVSIQANVSLSMCARFWSLLWITTILHARIFQYRIDIYACVFARLHKVTRVHDNNPRTQVCREIMRTQNITTESGRPSRTAQCEIHIHIHITCLLSFIVCIYIYVYIYIHTWLLRFSVFFLFFPPLSLPVSIRLQASAFETASLSLSISYSLTIHVQEPYLYYITASSFVFLRFLSRLLFPSRCSRRQKKKNYACPRPLLACSPPSLPRELSSLAKEKFAKCP